MLIADAHETLKQFAEKGGWNPDIFVGRIYALKSKQRNDGVGG